MKTPWQWLRGVVQQATEAPGCVAVAFRAWSCGNPGSGPLGATERWVRSATLSRSIETAADQELLQTLYALKSSKGKLGCGETE